MVEVTQADIEAAEEIGSLMATYYEYNRRSCYDDAQQVAAKFREAAFRAGEKSMRERAARVADKRAEDRFDEHGVRGACYQGSCPETYEELDAEDWFVAEAIASRCSPMIAIIRLTTSISTPLTISSAVSATRHADRYASSYAWQAMSMISLASASL